MNTYINRKPVLSPLSGVALLVYLLLMTVPSTAKAQNADIGLSVHPSPRVRLTGVLRAVAGSSVPTFPLIRVWIGGTPWLLHVCQIEPLIPAYPAEEELRKVSGLGLRLVTDSDELTILQRVATDAHPIVIEGQLRVRARLFRVDATYPMALAEGQ